MILEQLKSLKSVKQMGVHFSGGERSFVTVNSVE